MIPFLSLKEQTASIKSEVLGALERVIDSQGFANGPAVEAFEKEFANYLGVTDVVCVNSGTTALHAALICAGVKAGDEVVTVAHTWISTAWAISYAGATPVFCDVDATACMDPIKLRSAITPKTRAIVPVHLYGYPANLDHILEVAGEKGIPVIEDAAQSIGARYNAKHTGTLGFANATSFYPGKNLGAYGEGGAVITNNSEAASRVRCLRDHAQRGRHNHVEIGYNWRLDGFQGAVLSIKLRHLDAWNARRKHIADRYLSSFAQLPGLTMLERRGYADPCWHIFPVFHARRDEFRAELEKKGVQSGVHYPKPIHTQPAYAHLGVIPGSLPVSERLAREVISLPMYAELSDADVDVVVQSVIEVARQF